MYSFRVLNLAEFFNMKIKILIACSLVFASCANEARNNKKIFHYNEPFGIATLDPAFAKMNELGVGGLVVGADTFMNARSDQLAKTAARHLIPTVSPYREFTSAGGLMSYGANIAAASRQAGAYTGRILKGENPADLPIQQPTLFELSINVKSAKALGLTVSPTLLLQAEEVIE